MPIRQPHHLDWTPVQDFDALNRRLSELCANADDMFRRLFGVHPAPLISWNTKLANTVYQAEADGFIVGYIGLATAIADGYSDSSNPPITLRFRSTCSDDFVGDFHASFMMPVKKGDYYKVTTTTASGTATVVVYWVPLTIS